MNLAQTSILTAAAAMALFSYSAMNAGDDLYNTPVRTVGLDAVRTTPKQDRLPRNATAPKSAAIVLEGPAFAVDGKTIEIDQQRISLAQFQAYDANQMNSTGIECSDASKNALATMIKDWTIRCSGHLFDSGALLIAKCTRADGLDVNAAMAQHNSDAPQLAALLALK
jgi:endonuclease YncB( thermonuclease family)